MITESLWWCFKTFISPLWKWAYFFFSFGLQLVTFIIFFVKFSYSSPETSSRIHQSCARRSISQVPGPAVMERSGDLSLPQVHFLFSGFWGTVSCDGKARPQPPLHHDRHLNPFPLLAFYTTFYSSTGFQYWSVTAPLPFIHHYLLPAIFLLAPHPFLFYSRLPSFPAFLQCLFLSPAADQSIYLCHRFSSHLSLPPLFFPTPFSFPHPSSFSSFVEGLSAAGCW